MCVKIIRSKEEVEFNPQEPLEQQVRGAKQIVVNYDPEDKRIQSFMEQVERIVRTGVSCQMNICVKPNNTLAGLRVERQFEMFNEELKMNEVVKALVKSHHETDKRLMEMSEMCLGRNE